MLHKITIVPTLDGHYSFSIYDDTKDVYKADTVIFKEIKDLLAYEEGILRSAKKGVGAP